MPDVPWLTEIDFVIRDDRLEMTRQASVQDLTPVALSDADRSDIEAFLHSLTGATARSLPMGVPDAVPSGLPVD